MAVCCEDAFQAAYDHDVVFTYRFVNKLRYQVDAWEYGFQRGCGKAVIHQERITLPGNLDFVGETAKVVVDALYERRTNRC